MSPKNPERSTMRQIRNALQTLHRALLEAERLEYERSFGRIQSDFYLLTLAAEDPQFAWLRALTHLMLEVDMHLSGEAQVSPVDLRLTGDRVRALLISDDAPTPFQARYQRAMQEHPAVIMAHSAVIRSLPPASRTPLLKGRAPTDIQHYGDLRVQLYHPGELVPGHGDHGYGTLAVVAESFMAPGSVVPMHMHRNEEIVSWVPEGVMRHDDLAHGKLVTDGDHLLVMNAGRRFSHTERTLETDPSLRMLQIFVRPRAVDLEPRLQHGALPVAEESAWRLIVGSEGEDAPFSVRNEVQILDGRMVQGAHISLPQREGWHTWLFVYRGAVEIDGVRLGQSESVLVGSAGPVEIGAVEETLLIVFVINPRAKITRAGTVGR